MDRPDEPEVCTRMKVDLTACYGERYLYIFAMNALDAFAFRSRIAKASLKLKILL